MKSRWTDLQDLATLQQHLRAERERQQEAERQQRELEAQQAAEQQLFTRAVGPVRPLARPHQAALPPAPPPRVSLHPAHRTLQDQAQVLHESLSDAFDVESLLETDEALSFRQPGIGLDVLKRLRRGQWRVQAQVDLHGLRKDEARLALQQFILHSHAQGLRCVRVVHGKGLGSPGKTPVLKSHVLSWLAQKKTVLAYVQARPAEGGAGALVVLLAAH